MSRFADTQSISLSSLQQRSVPTPDGSVRSVSCTILVWQAMEYLIDLGHTRVERLVELADVEGWDPLDAPFDQRFASVISYWSRRCNARWNDYNDYCRGRI
jgi:hypothetical protein